MPVIRGPEDNSLAETLGNLGNALGSALNPMNQIRAQDMMAQMQQRRWEMQHAQTLDAANQNAARVFRNANPLGMDDASLEAAATAIGQGRYDPSQWVTATTGLAKQRAAQAASDAIDTDPDVQGYTSAERASIHARVLDGVSLADAKTQVANERLTSAKTSGALGARDAATGAVTPDMDPETKAFAGSLALSNPTEAEALLNKQRALIGAGALPKGIAIDDPRITQQNVRTEMGGLTPVPLAQAAGPQATADITKQTLIDRAKPRPPSEIVPAIPPTDPLTGGPAATGEGFGQAGTGPDAAATATTAAAEATGKAGSEYANTVLQGGIQEGQGAQTVLNDVNQLRYLAKVMNSDGPMDQLQNRLADEMYKKFGMTLTQGQSAREVFNNYVAALMGSWRKDVGIQRLALPEIQLGQLSLPNPNMSLDALNGALDFVEAKAQVSDKVGRTALRYWSDQTKPIEQRANDFLGERDKLYAPEANPAETIRKTREDKGTVGSPTGPKHYRFENGQRVEIPSQ